MNKSEIRDMRLNLGKFLHDYYIKFGEEKYDVFVEKMGKNMSLEYGEPFTSDNLRIMEAEYVTFNKVTYGPRKTEPKENISI